METEENIIYIRSRVGPGPAPNRTSWTGSMLDPGQGHLRVDRTSRARVRARKFGRGPARTDPWTVYQSGGDGSASRSGSTDRKKTENRTGQDRNGPDFRSWSLIFENERPQKTGLNEPVRTGSNRYFVVLKKTFKISPRMY
jgi:hypothetical protein